MTDLIWRSEDGSLVIQHRTVPTPAVERFLSQTLWGTRDVKYRVNGISTLLASIPDAHILTLESATGVLIGVCVAGSKRLMVAKRELPAIHVAMIAIDPCMTGKGHGRALAREARTFLSTLLGEAGFIYCFIEATNEVSLQLHRSLGYEDLCLAQAHLFGRLSPQPTPVARLLRPEERDQLVGLLSGLYKDHVGVDFAATLTPSRYVVLEREGRVVAGVQATEMNWSIAELQGLAGAFALNVLPKLPLVSRVFAPEAFRFLRFGNIFVEPDGEHQLTVLLESTLAFHDQHFGMMFLDPRSKIGQRLVAATAFGLPKALSAFGMNVLVGTKGLTTGEKEWLKSRPFQVSMGDMM